MTYYGVRELAAGFRTVRANTLKIAEEIPENNYDFRASPDTRSVAKTLVHIAFIPAFQLEVHGKKIDDLEKVDFAAYMQRVAADEAMPRSKADIIALLEAEGDKFAAFLEGLSESFLAEPVAMLPGAQPAVKSRFEMLLSAKEHEMHHRGQLMLVQRMIGIKPHLTRQMEERMARRAAQAQQAAR